MPAGHETEHPADPWEENVETAQGRHSLESVAPVEGKNVPAGHNVHDADPFPLKDPAGHGVHSDEPELEKNPAGQGKQSVELGLEVVPAGHDEQLDEETRGSPNGQRAMTGVGFGASVSEFSTAPS